jgi:hypothetical protein
MEVKKVVILSGAKNPRISFEAPHLQPTAGSPARMESAARHTYNSTMCRNIKNLFNFDPPVTDQEIRNASLQFVRKISGFNKPSKANEASFNTAIDEVADVCARLLHSLETTAPPKSREEEAAKAKARSAERFGTA